MTARQVSTLCSSSANFEKSTSYDKRFKLVSKLGTAPVTAHNVGSSAEFMYVLYALGSRDALIDIGSVIQYSLTKFRENALFKYDAWH